MQILHRGFDTIALAIQANISKELFDYLEAEKTCAENARQPVPIFYNGESLELLPHGGHGYRFILKGGPLNPIWFFKKPNARDAWGIRVSIGSILLATQGLGAVRARLNHSLERFGIKIDSNQISLARVDFCIDLLAQDFELVPANFVIHSHANRADHLATAENIVTNGKSGRFTSVTVGKMPGRQVIIYDKSREVIDKKKPIWWDIWNSNLERVGSPLLDAMDASRGHVWRVEVRAGKDLLKDRWNIRTWAQMDEKFGDVVAEAFEKVRYCNPEVDDSNRSRWGNHKLWDLARTASDGELLEMRTFMDPDAVKSVYLEAHQRLIFAQVFGNATTLAALEGTPQADLADYMEAVGQKMSDAVGADFDRAKQKLGEAKSRYRVIG